MLHVGGIRGFGGRDTRYGVVIRSKKGVVSCANGRLKRRGVDRSEGISEGREAVGSEGVEETGHI